MNILHFKSINFTKNQAKPYEINFSVETEFFNEDNFNIIVFKDPKNLKILNRFEISKSVINIFSGPSTLNMELNQKIANTFFDEKNNQINIDVELTNLKKIIENQIIFFYLQYNMFYQNQEISSYKLELKIES